MDRRNGGEVYPVKLNDGTTPEPGTAEIVRASHVCEHLNHADARHAIVTWARLLKPGGILKIAVPDLKWIAEKYLAGEKLPIASYIMGGQQDAEDYHRTVFDEEDLRACMEMAGLTDIKPWVSEIDDCARLPVSLNLQGTKPIVIPEQTYALPKIAAVMSTAKLGFTENQFSMIQLAVARGFAFEKVTGCFWGNCLTRVIEPHLDDGTEVLITCDFDTKADVADFDALMRLMILHPEIDAIAPLQVKRNEDNLLMGLLDENGKPYPEGTKLTTAHFAPEIIRASWAHFGFTAIKMDAIRKMKKPWFLGVPAPDGGWGEGRLDEDIFFWRNFAEAGNKLFLAPHVVIGHCQQVVTYPDQDLRPRHAYIPDVCRQGKPDWVRR